MKERILILDTTLRDGKQAVGVSMDTKGEMEIARQLDRLGVDIIEAGFPINSSDERAKVKAIAQEVRRPIICALARAGSDEDIYAAWEAVKDAVRPRIHVFLSSSDIHLASLLQKSPEEVKKMAVKGVKLAKNYCDDVEFTPMDSTRTGEFIYPLLEAVIDAGATTVNIADTVGCALPSRYTALIRSIADGSRVRNISKAVVSVHCHNDLEMAVANTLAGVEGGARQVEVTINGVGERPGNASLASVVMAIRHWGDVMGVSVDQIITQLLWETSQLGAGVTGRPVSPDKPIVGSSAFAHESGIHQDGTLKDPNNFQIMDPAVVGWRGSQIVLGQTSGRRGFQSILEGLGYKLEGEELKRAFKDFRRRAPDGKIDAEDLRQIADGVLRGKFILDESVGSGVN